MAAQGQKRPAQEPPASPKPPLAKVAKAGLAKQPPGGKAPLAKLPAGPSGKAPLPKVPPGGAKAALAKVSPGGGKAPLAKVPSGGTADVAKVPAGGKAALAKVPGGGKAAVPKVAKAAPPKAALAKVAPAKPVMEDEDDEQASAPETAPPAPATPPAKPAPKVPAAATPPAPATPPAGDEGDEEEGGEVDDEKKKRAANYKVFEDDDPLYALMGEAGTYKVYDKDEKFQPELMDKYLERIFVQKVVKKPNEWVELWACMDIPVDNQSPTIAAILRYGMKCNVKDLGHILACLLLGHRTKTKAIVEAVHETMTGIKDPSGILREFLFRIYPRGPNSAWGWSRIGWSWQEWWKIASSIIGCLESMSAFDELAQLLDRIESTGGKPLTADLHIWTEKRLEKCRTMLMEKSGLETEDDLWACIDFSLKR